MFKHRVRQRRDSRYNCSEPLRQVAERVPHSLLEKPLLPIHLVTSHRPFTEPCHSAQHLRGLVLCCSNFHQETSLCFLPATASSPQPIWVYGLLPWKTFSDLPPTPAVTLWFFLGRDSCRTTVVSVSLQGWAAGMNGLGLSQCAALHSQLFLQNAEISIR